MRNDQAHANSVGWGLVWMAALGLALLTLAAGCGPGTVTPDIEPPVGRYQAVHSGSDVWRLDTRTGTVCLLLSASQERFKTQTSCL